MTGETHGPPVDWADHKGKQVEEYQLLDIAC